MSDQSTSKFLSLVLRHNPDVVGIELDSAGWADVPSLLSAFARHGTPLDRETLERIVATDRKGRYALDEAGDRIRANQGHSIDVDLGLEPVEPPAVLFHGTPKRNVHNIQRQGLHRGQRHHVHLSADTGTAALVGSRRGEFVVLRVAAATMHRDGFIFFRSANGVWLTDSVPPRYLQPAE